MSTNSEKSESGAPCAALNIKGRRLNALAAQVPMYSKRLIDLGCDHATVPLELLCQGIVEELLLIDVNLSPLNLARKRVKENYAIFENRIQFHLADGLTNVICKKTDVLLCSGLGGEVIAKFFLDYFYNREVCRPDLIILQPQTKQYELRRVLDDLGFCISDEILIQDKKHIYTILIVDSSVNVINHKLSSLEMYIGPILLKKIENLKFKRYQSSDDKALLKWANIQLKRLNLEGITDSNRANLAEELALYLI